MLKPSENGFIGFEWDTPIRAEPSLIGGYMSIKRINFWSTFLFRKKKRKKVFIWESSTQDPPLGGTLEGSPQEGETCPEGRCFTSLPLIKFYLRNESFRPRGGEATYVTCIRR